MKTSPTRRHQAGYVSFLLVLSTGAILTFLMVSAYRRALNAQVVESQVQLRLDYSEKDEAILRSIVAIVPNRAIRAMQTGSNTIGVKEPLSWQNIFTEALVLANARTSISDGSNGPNNLLAALNIPAADLQKAQAGNSTALSDPFKIFAGISTDTLLDPSVQSTRAKGYVSVGINRNLGTGYPPVLTSNDATVTSGDLAYPIIAASKVYGTLAQPSLDSKTLNGNGSAAYGLPVTTYPGFNRLKYPNINFGYAKPGDPFVAKQNWWAFSVDAGGNESDSTRLAHAKREFVLSIYEIPSQLSISASSYMSLGQYASGAAWQDYNIDGGMFVGKADVTGTTPLKSLALRRGMTISNGSTIGGEGFTQSPFTPGQRESYLNRNDSSVAVSAVNQTTLGAFFPVSQASESGRAAFIPISRGTAFFDRFDSVENDPIEATGALNHVASIFSSTSSLSPTSWNNYTIGAQQCAMRVDINKVQSPTNSNPTELRFQYYKPDGTRAELALPVIPNSTTLPLGYTYVCDSGGSATYSGPVDLAYGASGGYTYIEDRSGPVTFNVATFGDPLQPGDPAIRKGYWRPRVPFKPQTLTSTQVCVAVYPERIAAFLTAIGGAGIGINNSLAVNVDYSASGLNNPAKYKPSIPCRPTYVGDPLQDYGVILKECGNLTAFTKGFSLVTNLRLYIGDDFNITPTTPPSGFTPTVTLSNPNGRFYPPCSLFTPEKRYGVDADPLAVVLGGQIGSLAKVDKVNTGDADAPVVRPLDSKALSGLALAANKIKVNLSQIRHPAELPPITMMNWLILLEERRREFN